MKYIYTARFNINNNYKFALNLEDIFIQNKSKYKDPWLVAQEYIILNEIEKNVNKLYGGYGGF